MKRWRMSRRKQERSRRICLKKMVSPVSMWNYHDMTFNYFNVVLAADSI